MRWIRALIAASLLLGASQGASALCVLCSCSASVPTVAFGNYTPGVTGTVDITRTMDVSCGGVAGFNLGYTVALSAGASNNFSTRAMTSGSNTLSYNLFHDGTSLIWGDGTGGSSTVPGSMTLIAVGSVTNHHTVFARLYGSQNVQPGSYSDTITVTVTW